MRNVLATMVALGVFGFAMVGCGGDSCLSRCEQGKTEGCVPESTDCDAACETAEEQEADARMRAATAGCSSEFDTAVACFDALPVCETGCTNEGQALTDCFVAFCTDNPTSEACTAP